jgi:hypothetical protein
MLTAAAAAAVAAPRSGAGTSVVSTTDPDGDGPSITLPLPRPLAKQKDKPPVQGAAGGETETGQGQTGTGDTDTGTGTGESEDSTVDAGRGTDADPAQRDSGPAPAGSANNALLRRRPSELNAALLPREEKKKAAGPGQCVSHELIPNGMPDLGARPISGRRSFPWATVGLALAAAGALVAAFAVGRRRGRGSVLEIAAATVGILGGLAALAGQFTGVGHREQPPPQATAVVREVYARVPRGEYMKKMEDVVRQGRVSALDKRELGNVVWLQIDLTGYRQAEAMRLEWASYGAASGSGELPETQGTAKLRLVHRDHQKQFIPVWVGLPEVKYQVQFRIVDPRTDVVQGMASTGAMRGERHRYSCASKT